MKKFGFTLAEVLITMTIIGVVAALTTPALYNNAHNAQVGPKLAKIKSTIENANEQLMQVEEVGRLSTLLTDIPDDSSINQEYVNMLSTNMRLEQGTRSSSISDFYNNAIGNITLTDIDGGQLQGITDRNIIDVLTWQTVEGANIGFDMQANRGADGGHWFIYVDINGSSTPNRFGRDIFAFILNNNGSLTPYGEFNNANNNASWQNLCPSGGPVNNADATAGLACTATIFANNLQITYDE